MSRISSSGGYKGKQQGGGGDRPRRFSTGVMTGPPCSSPVQKAIHLRAHRQLDDFDLVGDDPWLAALVQGSVKHLSRIGMELVGEARPVEVEAEKITWSLARFQAWSERLLTSLHSPRTS